MTPTPFRIVLISPPGYDHAEALREVVETLHFGLRALGHPVTMAINDFDPAARNILVGGNLMPVEWIERVPSGTILYNLEQWQSSWIGNEALPALMARCETWDYDAHNLDRLREAGLVGPSRHVPIGYVPELTRIPVETETIDVLFYGSLNERRRRILVELEEAGLAVQLLFGLYGQARDAVIARSRIILNIHYYDTKIFEIARISYLLANAKAVVTEKDPETRIDPALDDAMAAVPYDQLVATCIALIRDEPRRQAMARAGFERFSARLERDILREALGDPRDDLSHPPSGERPVSDSQTQLPTILNIGSGKNFRAECLNLDIHDGWQPDLIADLNHPLPLPDDPLHPTRRFGPIRLPRGYFEQILAFDVFEHVQDLITAMTSCLNLLRVGGTLHIVVPYDLSLGAWQDPTHVRAFNENSWQYYTDWFWYLGWRESRFVLRVLNYNLSPLGMRMNQNGETVETIIRTPRAVDAMEVVLEKVVLSEADREASRQFRPGG
ncbi:hypothetical protein SIID45300_03074 [Candidatus Magnetaquicoccaceae bacterium FCR-1]|uniref:Methyltransferase domain-containing protein n=1 Tax=Candidatus Magnetaquiglobus chichijimensis TaxID=3141448 RepID=A0ABQ0CCV0_9PROT